MKPRKIEVFAVHRVGTCQRGVLRVVALDVEAYTGTRYLLEFEAADLARLGALAHRLLTDAQPAAPLP